MLFPRPRRWLIALLIAALSLFAYQKARAFVDETGAFLPLIAAGAAAAAAGSGGGAAIITSTATASAPAIGLGPVGWFAAGAVVLGAVAYVAGRAIVVDSRSLASSPNPALNPGDAVPIPGSRLALGAAPGLSFFTFTQAQLDALPTTATTSGPIFDLGRILFSYSGATLQYVRRYNSGILFASLGHNYSSSALPQGIPGSMFYGDGPSPGGSPDGLSHTALYLPYVLVSNAFSCANGAVYNYSSQTCITEISDESPEAADGYCAISWSASSGCPLFNNSDPDCTAAAAGISLSCGTSTVAPSVSILDKSTGATVAVSRPAVSGQGTVGALTVKETTPQPATGTTRVATTTTAAPAAGAAPAVSGGGQQTFPGTGASTGTTALSAVTVANWPNGLDAVAGYLEVIANNTAPGNQPAPVVQFPDTIKINDEGKSADLPDADAQLAAIQGTDGPDGFLQSLKDKFNPFTAFHLPAHTSECPVIRWNSGDIGAMSFDFTDNTICDLLEQYRTILQTFFMIAWTFAAIGIILAA